MPGRRDPGRRAGRHLSRYARRAPRGAADRRPTARRGRQHNADRQVARHGRRRRSGGARSSRDRPRPAPRRGPGRLRRRATACSSSIGDRPLHEIVTIRQYRRKRDFATDEASRRAEPRRGPDHRRRAHRRSLHRARSRADPRSGVGTRAAPRLARRAAGPLADRRIEAGPRDGRGGRGREANAPPGRRAAADAERPSDARAAPGARSGSRADLASAAVRAEPPSPRPVVGGRAAEPAGRRGPSPPRCRARPAAARAGRPECADPSPSPTASSSREDPGGHESDLEGDEPDEPDEVR